jgi:eukaryotic-like serine/threonine-protein kinase
MSEEIGRPGGSQKIRDALFISSETADRNRPEIYEFGPFCLEPAERKLLNGGDSVDLTPKVFDMLVMLVRNSGHLLEKDELIRALWPDSFVEEGNLSNNIFMLRKALGTDHEYIETVPRQGYRFVGAVRQLPRAEKLPYEPRESGSASPADRRLAGPVSVFVPPAIRSPLYGLAVLAGTAVVLGGFGLYLLKPPPPQAEGFRFGPSGIDVRSPMWSPDGKAIVYVAKPTIDTRDQLFLRYLNSPVGIQLTHMPADQAGHLIPLGWSNDRSHIVFAKKPNILESLFRVYSIPTVGGTAEFVMDHRFIEDCCAATLSPDGKALVSFGRGDAATYGLYISDPLGTEPRRYLPDPFAAKGYFNFPSLRFSPDGKKLLFIIGDEGEEVWLLPFPEGSKPPRRLSLSFSKTAGTPRFDWMPDSRHIVVSQDLPAHLWMVDTETASMTRLTGGTEMQVHPLVAPDGKSVIYAQYVPRLSVVSVSVLDGTTRTVVETGREESMPSWSAKTGKLVWVSNRNGPYEIWVRETDGSERPIVTGADFPPGTTLAFMGPAISPDGERVIYQRADASEVSRLWISSLSGGPPLRLTNVEPDDESSGSWSPDGGRFAYFQEKGAKKALMTVKASGNATPEVLNDSDPDNEIPDWSPMGDWISFKDCKGGFHLISPDGQTSKALGKIGNETNFLAFSKDGKLLYGLHWGEPGPGPDVKRGILFSLDPVTLKQKVIKDLGPSFAPDSNMLPGIRFSFAPDGQSFVYTINQTQTDWWILQGLPQPGWRERLRGLFSWNPKPEAVSAPGANRP